MRNLVVYYVLLTSIKFSTRDLEMVRKLELDWGARPRLGSDFNAICCIMLAPRIIDTRTVQSRITAFVVSLPFSTGGLFL